MASQYRDRNYAPGALVHLTCRGFRRRPIFLDAHDHLEFLNAFRSANARLPRVERLTEHAYAQMPNHQHLLVKNGEAPDAVSSVMHSALTRYAMYFNWRHGRRGKVFEKSFRGKVLRSVEHVANAFAYIHLNPDASLRDENSSHGVYIGSRDDPRIDRSLAWRVFGGCDGYVEYFEDTTRLRAARTAAKQRLDAY